MSPTTRQIALLRGINLGRSRRVAMAALRAALVAHGFTDVKTHLQSGNVVLSHGTAPIELAAELERVILSELGMEVRVVVRTAAELADAIARDPLGEVATDPQRHQVTFLATEIAAAAVERLLATDIAPEVVAVSGREIYSWHPAGVAGSSLAALLSERRLGVTATTRNWNTVTKLLALAGS